MRLITSSTRAGSGCSLTICHLPGLIKSSSTEREQLSEKGEENDAGEHLDLGAAGQSAQMPRGNAMRASYASFSGRGGGPFDSSAKISISLTESWPRRFAM